jgi:hypothetical protein
MKKPFNPPGNFDARADWAGQKCAEINASIEQQIERIRRGDAPLPEEHTQPIGAPSAPPDIEE